MKTGVVLTAANMEAEEKGFIPLLKVGNITVVERVVGTFRQAGVDKIVLVSGEHAQEVEDKISHMGVTCLRDEDYRCSDLWKSARIGFSYLVGLCGRIGFCPVDIPMFTADTVKRLMNSTQEAICPYYNGRGGHPLVLSSAVVKKLLSYEGTGGIPAALKSCGIRKSRLEVEDAGTMLDVSKEEVSKELVESLREKMLRPQIKLSIAREQIFFGPGTKQLLELLEETGSVRSACKLMHLSYSKGWKMIRLMEEEWGEKIVERKQGGTAGGSSSLTESGQDLIRRYAKFEKEANECITAVFRKYFADSI